MENSTGKKHGDNKKKMPESISDLIAFIRENEEQNKALKKILEKIKKNHSQEK